ncbi:MAG TPA: 5-methyltetrahydropteroyltriglutamate--homocysteine S-methyltransferase [Vicinamibacterales bacterium]|nr:5-methyltetrahydropteroyltriglutamate--homocysteine S-methyltransferase [Vicinamibacterales bacterium]
MSTPPFRAEHVGSLLRPASLLQARTAAEGDQYRQVSGPLKFDDLKQLEDAAIAEAVALQESVGLQSITDGEFRRRSWFQDFLLSLSGTGIHWIEADRTISAALPFQNDTTVEKLPGHIVRVTGKIRRTKGIFTDAFAFLKRETKRTPKISIPSPTMLHFWGGRDAIDRAVYPDMEEFWNDAVAAWTAEIKELASLGATYIQIDDVTFPLVCDPHAQDALKGRGEDPHTLVETYASVLNRIVAATPKGVTLGMHMCRGNNRGKWMGSGGYEYVSEVVLRNVDIPNYFMEYDTDRAGDFQPLRHVPKGKHVILGLISTKTPVLESKDVVKRRIDEAAKVLPLDQLCLSPQCGFASNFMGNPVTVDDEKKKLSLVVEIAREVWG